MNKSPSGPPISPESIFSSKLTSTNTQNKASIDNFITFNEKVNLTKQQYQVLKIICDTYETSVSEYTQQALVEAMRFDIEEGNFSDTLLEKIGIGDSKHGNSSSSSSLTTDLTNSDLDLVKQLHAQI